VERSFGRRHQARFHGPHPGNRRFEKLERAYALGLDAGLDYKENPEWDRWAMDETGGNGVDLIVEVGGIATLPRSLRALRIGGAIAQVGVLSGATDPKPFPISTILHKQVRMQGIYVGSRQDFEDLNKAITLAVLRPVGENFHWSQAREALARMEEGSHFGKLVLTVG
jgi:NADPH:quinone reductase-like Zn-dependent oxidoreductase